MGKWSHLIEYWNFEKINELGISDNTIMVL